MLGDQRLVLDRRDDKLVLEALGVAEAKGAIDPLGIGPRCGQALFPEVERLVGCDAPDDAVDHSLARAALRGVRELEEGHVGARAALLVGVEEVVDARLVLVHGLLDHAEAEGAGVEVDVLLRVGRDRCDVVDSVELHELVLSGTISICMRNYNTQ